MEWPLLAHADLIVGLGVDEAEMIPAAWTTRQPPTVLVSEWPTGPTGVKRESMARTGLGRPALASTRATSYFTGATT